VIEWTVPGYTEVRELGGGISGRVAEAVHEASGRRVAIKYLSPALVLDPRRSARRRRQPMREPPPVTTG
jgi:eukaryotic-like serine/threonine-protein kinase